MTAPIPDPYAKVVQLENGRWEATITLPGFGQRLRTFDIEQEAHDHVLDMVEMYGLLSEEKAA